MTKYKVSDRVQYLGRSLASTPKSGTVTEILYEGPRYYYIPAMYRIQWDNGDRHSASDLQLKEFIDEKDLSTVINDSFISM